MKTLATVINPVLYVAIVDTENQDGDIYTYFYMMLSNTYTVIKHSNLSDDQLKTAAEIHNFLTKERNAEQERRKKEAIRNNPTIN